MAKRTAGETDGADYSAVLRSLMAQAGISSYRALSQISGIARTTLDRLRRGQVGQLRVDTLQRLSHSLKVPVTELIERFGMPLQGKPPEAQSETQPEATAIHQLRALKQECNRLQTQLTTQAETIRQQVQQEAIAQLEPWLVQWPTAAHAAQQRADLPAQKLVPLVRPIEALVQNWGVTQIASVGAEVPFDPHTHQPKDGSPSPGQVVRVTHVGYRQGDRLLHRARVVPLNS